MKESLRDVLTRFVEKINHDEVANMLADALEGIVPDEAVPTIESRLSTDTVEPTGAITEVAMSTDRFGVVIKLSNGTAYAFDARWPDNVLSADVNEFAPPFWQPMHT